MIKNIFTILICLMLSFRLYPIDFSLGFNILGFGYSFARGKDYNAILEARSTNNSKQLKLSDRYIFSDTININTRFDFNKYLALESGIGYNIKSTGYQYEKYSIYDKVMFKYNIHLLSIPILLIAKYDINEKYNIYFAFGPKLNIKLYSNLIRTLTNEKINQISPYELNPYAYRIFAMDILFAVGSEYQFRKNQYVGLRLNYNVNVLGHLNKWNKGDSVWEMEDYYVDGLSLSITYRYLLKTQINK